MHDAVVCGGGVAGLAAATWLGRYRRKTVLVDEGLHRNRFTQSAHGYLCLDGATPDEILAAARKDLDHYESVSTIADRVVDVERSEGSFLLHTGEEAIETRRVVLATGVEDVFPDVDGFLDFYGRTIFHCSCCDGYEARDERVAAIGWSPHVAGFALDLLDWGAEVILLTDGRTFEGDESCRSALGRHDIEIVEDPVRRIVSEDDAMTGIELEGGQVVDCVKAFFSIGHKPRNDVARRLGCELDDDGYVEIGEHGETSVDGVYAAGDVTPGEQLLQVAAAQGAIAGIACAMSLRGEYPAPGGAPPGPDPEEELEGSP